MVTHPRAWLSHRSSGCTGWDCPRAELPGVGLLPLPARHRPWQAEVLPSRCTGPGPASFGGQAEPHPKCVRLPRCSPGWGAEPPVLPYCHPDSGYYGQNHLSLEGSRHGGLPLAGGSPIQVPRRVLSTCGVLGPAAWGSPHAHARGQTQISNSRSQDCRWTPRRSGPQWTPRSVGASGLNPSSSCPKLRNKW